MSLHGATSNYVSLDKNYNVPFYFRGSPKPLDGLVAIMDDKNNTKYEIASRSEW